MFNPIHDFWFNSNAKEIYIVCSRESNPPKWAYKYSNNYAYSDNFGDKDLLFYLYGLMSKNYPNSTIYFYFSDDYMEKVRNWEQKNILIVGGPNSRNEISKFGMYDALMKRLDYVYELDDKKSYLIYPPKPENELREWENKKYTKEKICKNCSNSLKYCPRLSLCINNNNSTSFVLPEFYDELIIYTNDADDAKIENERRCRDIANGKKVAITGCVKKDVGFFASFANPYDSMKENKIVMLSGLHTFGGVGVYNALSAQTKYSVENYNLLYYSLIGRENRDFMTYFEVEVSEQRDASYSRVVKDRIFSLSNLKLKNFYNTFISYRRRNGTMFSEKIYDILVSKKDNAIFPFRDIVNLQSNFKPGADYVKDIINKIRNCEIFILTITENCFVYDEDVDGGFKDEFILAVKYGKRIIPIEDNNSNYYDEINKIKVELTELFGIDKFRELLHYNSIKINDTDELINVILSSLREHYEEVE